MEVKIAVQNTAREIVLESSESSEDIEARVAEAIGGGVLALTDTKGRRIVVPGDRIAFVEIGGGVSGQVGFRS